MTKDELIEKYRDINVEYVDWWDCVYDDFTSDMAEKHIMVQDTRFSGFWSQGDGASFTGYISNNLEFLKAHGLTETYPFITKLIHHGGDFTLRIERSSSHYVHENTVSVSVEGCAYFHHVLPTSDDLREAIVDQWDTDLDAEYERIWEDVTDIIRDYCRDLYRKLQEEYDYLTSDEAVWEAIEANELNEPQEEEV